MKARELELLDQLCARGIPREFAKTAVDWTRVRANPQTTLEDVSLHLYRSGSLPIAGLIPIPGVGDVTDIAGDALGEALKFLLGLFTDPPAPRPETIPPYKRELEWCKTVKVCELGKGQTATLEVSNNGVGGPDDEGEVEITYDAPPPIPGTLPPVQDSIVGNGKLAAITGPKTVYAHLKGGTKENPAEKACDIKVTIQKFGK